MSVDTILEVAERQYNDCERVEDLQILLEALKTDPEGLVRDLLTYDGFAASLIETLLLYVKAEATSWRRLRAGLKTALIREILKRHQGTPLRLSRL